MTTLPFRQIDVFGSDPYTGNPVAVVLGADGLSTEQMARISAWTNLSECTFVLESTDPGADYRVRIFSLATELPFAGHPTLGTARAWLDAGGVPAADAVVQQCAAGLVPVRVDGDQLAFAAPPLVRSGPVEEEVLAAACARLGLARGEVVDAAWVDNGPGWMGILLADAQRVLALEPDLAAGQDWPFLGVAGRHHSGGPEGVDLEVRAFFGEDGAALREDPITGSLNASLAQWLTSSGQIGAPYVAAQGTRIGREGRVKVTADAGELWIGGRTHLAVTGTIDA